MNKTKPQLVLKMKSIDKKLNDFYRLLYHIGDLADLVDNQFNVKKELLKIASGKLKQLQILGINNEDRGDYIVLSSTQYPNCFPAWKKLVQICNPNLSQVSPEFLWFLFIHSQKRRSRTYNEN